MFLNVRITTPSCGTEFPQYGYDFPSSTEPGGIVIESYCRGSGIKFSSLLSAIIPFAPHFDGCKQFMLTPTASEFFWLKTMPEEFLDHFIQAAWAWVEKEGQFVIANECNPCLAGTPEGKCRSMPFEHWHFVSLNGLIVYNETKEVEVESAEVFAVKNPQELKQLLRRINFQSYSIIIIKNDGAVRLGIVVGAQANCLIGLKSERNRIEGWQPSEQYIKGSLQNARSLRQSLGY